LRGGGGHDAARTITEPVKLHYQIDRRDFVEKVKSVYASYAA
jgi:hypothetical protein